MSEQYSKTRKSLAKIDFFENHNILEEKDKSKSTGVINKPVLNNVCQGDKIERKPTVRAEYAGHYTKFGDAMGALFSAHYNEIKALKEENSKLKIEDEKHKEQISKLKVDYSKQNEKLSKLEVENSSRKEEISKLKNENSKLAASVTGLWTEQEYNTYLMENNKFQQCEIDRLEEEKKKITFEYKKYFQKYGKLKIEFHRLTGEEELVSEGETPLDNSENKSEMQYAKENCKTKWIFSQRKREPVSDDETYASQSELFAIDNRITDNHPVTPLKSSEFQTPVKSFTYSEQIFTEDVDEHDMGSPAVLSNPRLELNTSLAGGTQNVKAEKEITDCVNEKSVGVSNRICKDDEPCSKRSKTENSEKEISKPFKYHQTVRNTTERKKLKGYSCRECEEFYKAAGLQNMGGEGECHQHHLNEVSRHRYVCSPNHTPEGFWNMSFPESGMPENE